MRGVGLAKWASLLLAVSLATAGRGSEISEIRAAEFATRGHEVALAPLLAPPSWSTELLVLNRSWRPIDLRVEVLRESAPPLLVGDFMASPKQSWSMILPPESLRGGSAVRVSYFDLPDALQSRLVFRGPGTGARADVFTLQLLSPSPDARGSSWFVTWPDARSGRRVGAAQLVVSNATDAATRYRIRGGSLSREFELGPWQRRIHDFAAEQAPVVVEALDETGGLLLHGVQIVAARHVVLDPPGLASVLESGSLTTVTTPSAGGRVEDVVVVLGNATAASQQVPLLLQSLEDGGVVDSRTLMLPGLGAETVSLPALWPAVEDWSAVRLSVGPMSGGVSAEGFVELPDGTVAELGFFPLDEAHGSGSYPLPDLAANRAILHLLNVSPAPTFVGVAVAWDGGEYSLPTFEVPPGAAVSHDLNALAAVRRPDLRGRMVPPSVEHAVLRWIALSGGHQLLARLEVGPAGGDQIGLNCYGCCWEIPWGGIVEDDVTLTNAGESAQFAAVVSYSTCWGDDGPFDAPDPALSFGSPFIWDGHTVSATDGGEDSLTFTDYVLETKATCRTVNRRIIGAGKVNACELFLRGATCKNGRCNPGKTCTTQTTSCEKCNGCCGKIRSYNECRGVSEARVVSEYNACIGHCATDLCS